MSIVLQQLNNESILLMYLAGELPAEDRAEVEQMLAGDRRLREELEQLRVAYEGVGAALDEADAVERLAIPPATAARRVGQAVHAWHARRLALPPAGLYRRRMRLPRWAYPIAAAALLAIGYTAWWGLQSDEPVRRIGGNQNQTGNGGFGDATGLSAEERLVYIGPWEDAPLLRDEADAELDDVEADLYALLNTPSDVAFADDGSSHLLMGETDER